MDWTYKTLSGKKLGLLSQAIVACLKIKQSKGCLHWCLIMTDCSLIKVTLLRFYDNSVFTQLEGISFHFLDVSIIQTKKTPFFWHAFVKLLKNCDMSQTLTVILWQQNSQA